MSTDGPLSRTDWFTAISVALGIIAVPSIAFLGIISSLSLDGTRHPPTDGEVVQFWVVVGVAVVVQLAALVRAIVRRRAWLMVVHSALTVLVAAAAVLFAVPPVEWPVAPASDSSPAYVPCFSGSGDCVGG